MCRAPAAVSWVAQRDSAWHVTNDAASGPRELLAQSHFRDRAHRIRAFLMADDEQAQ